MGGPVQDLTVSRDTIYEDAMAGMARGPQLKGRVRVTFNSDLGHQEAGIDGGGLFKDFMDALTERGLLDTLCHNVITSLESLIVFITLRFRPRVRPL